MRNSFLIPLLILLLGASLIGNFFQWRAAEDWQSVPVAMDTVFAAPAQPAQVISERYVAKDGTNHALAADPVRTRKTEEKRRAVGGPYLDTVAKALNVSVKQIDELEHEVATLKAENIRLTQSNTNPKRQEYKDSFLSLVYNSDSNTIDSLSYIVELTRTRYWKRPWLLASKRYYNDIFSADQRVTINSVRRFTLPEPGPKKFGIGFQVGYGFPVIPAPKFSFQPPAPYIGIGFSYNLVRF